MGVIHMGEGDIQDVLFENKGWMTAEEITNKIDVSRASVNYGLRMLVKAKIVMSKKHHLMKNGYLYKLVVLELENE